MDYESKEKWKRRMERWNKVIFKILKWIVGIIITLAIIAYAINHPTETFKFLKEIGRIALNIIAWIGQQLSKLGSNGGV